QLGDVFERYRIARGRQEQRPTGVDGQVPFFGLITSHLVEVFEREPGAIDERVARRACRHVANHGLERRTVSVILGYRYGLWDRCVWPDGETCEARKDPIATLGDAAVAAVE